MDHVLDFAAGPLFRFAFAVMILGLLRVLFLSVNGVIVMMRRSGDKAVPWNDLFKQTLAWSFPIDRLHKARPVYSFVSVLFHIGLILVPLFYSGHVILFESAAGFSWGFWIPQNLSHILTLLTLVAAAWLLINRFVHPGARVLSDGADYGYLILIMVPFATGILMTNGALAPVMYEWTYLVHLLSANLLMILVPFTKIAHAALFPVGRYVASAAWKFPVGAGDRVMHTLGKPAMREEMKL